MKNLFSRFTSRNRDCARQAWMTRPLDTISTAGNDAQLVPVLEALENDCVLNSGASCMATNKIMYQRLSCAPRLLSWTSVCDRLLNEM